MDKPDLTALICELHQVFPVDSVLHDKEDLAPYECDGLSAYRTLPMLVVIPETVEQIASTLSFEQDFEEASSNLRQWILQGHPITASSYLDDQFSVRLSSTINGAKSARAAMGGDLHSNDLWASLRHQTHPFFRQHKNLWRVSVPPSARAIASGQPQLTEWNGALRWIASDKELFTEAKDAGGHACQYRLRGEPADTVFQPVAPAMLALHRRLKKSFDPENILNPGRLYPEL